MVQDVDCEHHVCVADVEGEEYAILPGLMLSGAVSGALGSGLFGTVPDQ
jgi:hypothetical protein